MRMYGTKHVTVISESLTTFPFRALLCTHAIDYGLLFHWGSFVHVMSLAFQGASKVLTWVMMQDVGLLEVNELGHRGSGQEK
jgi:hypothetical protein